MRDGADRPVLLLVGGGGGLVGRNLLPSLRDRFSVRSVHRHAAAGERGGVEWVPTDAAAVTDWRPLLDHVEVVVNLAWYRAGPRRRFVRLGEGLLHLIRAAEAARVHRFLHISVPPAPAKLETGLPYLVEKRRVDRALEESTLSYRIVEPTMLFGPRDKLLTVMMRTMARYRRFPMFGEGEYHVSPLSVRDLSRILVREIDRGDRGTVTAGGPRRWRYRELTDRMFQSLGLRPRYVSMSARGAVRLARLLEALGSSLLYAYEVEWLLSDLLGLPAYEGLPEPLEEVEPFLGDEARRWRDR